MLDLTTNDEQKYDNDSMFLDLEWIGIQQENLRSQYVVHQEYLDCCLLIGKLIDDNYVEPVKITDCYKRKTQFQKVYVQLERNKKYILIPYTSEGGRLPFCFQSKLMPCLIYLIKNLR